VTSFISDKSGVWKVNEDGSITLVSLSEIGVAATLNVVLGLWPLQDAANAVGLTPDDLIAEAQAWEAARS
jgi:hypothetical protein